MHGHRDQHYLTIHVRNSVEFLLSSHNSQQKLKMSSCCITSCMSMVFHGVLHTFKGPGSVANRGAVANGMRGIKNVLAKCPFMLNWSCMHYGDTKLLIVKNMLD